MREKILNDISKFIMLVLCKDQTNGVCELNNKPCEFDCTIGHEACILAEYYYNAIRQETAREILQKIIDFMEAWTNDQYLPDEIVENIEALEKNIKIGIKEEYGVEVK